MSEAKNLFSVLRQSADPETVDAIETLVEVAPDRALCRINVLDFAAKAGQATECRLDVTSGTAKTVIEIEMPKGGVEIVVPHQPDHAATEPHAFRVSGRPVDGLRRFDEFVGLALAVLGRIGRCGRICGRFARLILGAALGERAANTDQKCEPGDGEVAQNRKLKLKHPSTHKFPEMFACGQLKGAGLMTIKWVPIAAETPPKCQGKSQQIP